MSTLVDLAVTGKDRTGVVARITSYLFEAGANIEALEERVRRGEFLMNLQATFPKAFTERKLRRELAALGAQLGMEMRVRVHAPGKVRRAGILVTKEPHALEAIMAAVASKSLAVEPAFVAGTKKDLAPLAKKLGLPFHHVPWTTPQRAEARMMKIADAANVDLLVLARFMRILSPGFVWRYPSRIVNVHPSLLPAFPGASAYRQAWEKGVRVAGATAHFVTPDLDQGPILAQRSFAVGREWSVDQIRTRGQQAESEALVEALQLVTKEDLDVHWGRVW